MLVIKLKTDHFSSRELHSNGSQKTMNPVLITQGPLPAPGKYFSSPTETPGENQGHCHIPGCPSLLSWLSPAICGMHADARMRTRTSNNRVHHRALSCGAALPAVGPGRDDGKQRCPSPSSLVRSQSRASEPPSIDRPPTHREGEPRRCTHLSTCWKVLSLKTRQVNKYHIKCCQEKGK